MDIKETSFGPKTYLAIKKSISTDQITDKQMYDDAGKKLGAYMAQNGIKPIGAWSVLYFSWDEKNKKTDLAIGFPVEGVSTVSDPELCLIDLPESNASLAVLKGDYSGLGQTHEALMEYSGQHKFNTDLLIMGLEEYTVGPMENPNPQNWITNIYHLHN